MKRSLNAKVAKDFAKVRKAENLFKPLTSTGATYLPHDTNLSLPEEELKRRLFERIYSSPMEKFVASAAVPRVRHHEDSPQVRNRSYFGDRFLGGAEAF